MSKEQDKFFLKKKPWSTIKDNMLGEYLIPYATKLLTNNKPIHYVDCFAGKGRFDDGNDGSPIVALNALEKVLGHSKARWPRIKTYFIENEYAKDLETNIKDRCYTRIINGNYEQEIDVLLRNFVHGNVFLYLDPYGIRYLDMYRFQDLKNSGFKTIECLINFNSFGFFRVACTTLGVRYVEGDSDDVYDYDFYYYFKKNKSEALLNKIAGGEYWKDVILEYKENNLSAYDAEELLSKKYRETLKKHYPYVLDLPIRLKDQQITKYRLIHLTAHPDGCLLMAKTMLKQEGNLGVIQRKGQLSLFGDPIKEERQLLSKRLLLDHINSLEEQERIDVVLAQFYTNHGLICAPETLRKYIKELEINHLICVKRERATTAAGKPRTNLNETKNSRIWLTKI